MHRQSGPARQTRARSERASQLVNSRTEGACGRCRAWFWSDWAPSRRGAQRRPMGSVPPSQAVSTLTTATSLGLVAAGARTAFDRGSSATRCVTGVAASLPGAAGKGFLISAGQHIRTLPVARPGAPTHHVVLVGFRDGNVSAVRCTEAWARRCGPTTSTTSSSAIRPPAAGASSDRVLPARATTCGIPQLVSRRCA